MGRFVLLLVAVSACGRFGFDDHVTPPDECVLALDPGAPRLNFFSERAIQSSGGAEPIEYTIAGPAAIDALGVVRARGQAGTAMIHAVDAGNCTADATLQIGGDALWYVGGTSMAVPSAQVWSSPDGIMWTQTGSLPDKRTSGALLVFHDRLWWISGSDGVGLRDEVWSSDDGATWTVAGHVPLPSTNFGNAVFADRMWTIGGGANPDTTRVYSSADGSAWTLEGNLPDENHGGCAVVAGGKLWYLGGHSNTDGTLFDWVLSSSTGAAWQQVGTMPNGREYAVAYELDGAIIVAGGQDLASTKTTSVISTTNGSTFTPQPMLPVARAFGAIAWFADRTWAIGGTDGGAVFSASRGAPWTTPATSFPVPRQGGKLAVFSAAR